MQLPERIYEETSLKDHSNMLRESKENFSIRETLELGQNNFDHTNASQIPKVSEVYNQLSTYLDNLSQKFTEVKEKQQADFLLAYKNHMNKVRRELQELKQRSEEQEKQLNQNDRVQNIEKQLSWFREESIQLYQKLDIKNKENYELKFRLEEVEKERQFLENQVKQLLKKNRLLEVYLYQKENTDTEKPKPPQEVFFTNPPNYDHVQSKVYKHMRPMSSSPFESKHFPIITQIVTEHQQSPDILSREVTQYVQIQEQQRENIIKSLNLRVQTLIKQSTKNNMIRSDLENFFLDCVETVRRQVMKRRMNEQIQINPGLQDYNVFRNEDKQRILELLLTHEKLLVYLYQKIFPTHFSSYVQSFTSALGTNAQELASDALAKNYQDQAIMLPMVSGDNSFDIGSKHKPYEKEQKKSRSQSIRVSEKLAVKKGKLIFKPNPS